MVIRIRWRRSSEFHSHQAALGLGALLAPVALVAFTLAFWQFASETGWAAAFPLRSGAWSHWQVWLLLAALLGTVCQILGKLGSRLLIETASPETHNHGSRK